MMAKRRLHAAVAALSVTALVAACGSDDSGGGGGKGNGPLEVWTLENLPDRLAAQEEIAKAFTKESGIQVKLTGIDEDQFNQLLTSSPAAGKLPDVVGALPLSGVQALATNELNDPDAAAAVI